MIFVQLDRADQLGSMEHVEISDCDDDEEEEEEDVRAEEKSVEVRLVSLRHCAHCMWRNVMSLLFVCMCSGSS